MTNLAYDTLRTETLRTILAHVDAGMPCPSDIEMMPATDAGLVTSLTMRFANDAPAVDRWRELLRCAPARTMAMDSFVSYRADRWFGIDDDPPVWLGWRSVVLITFLPLPTVEQVAEALVVAS